MKMQGNQAPYWSKPATALLAELSSTPDGLCTADASQRLVHFGPNALGARRRTTALVAFLQQFRNPLVLILVFAAALSAFMQEWTDAAIIIVIVLGSAALSFVQEFRATTAVEKLRARVAIKATVLRDGKSQLVPADEIVPGDVVFLSAGSLIPADGVVLDAKDFFVSQAVLTGETFPVEKKAGIVAPHTSLAERTNSVFMGTSVRSGTARALMTQTGATTVFGEIAQRLNLRPPVTEFERGIMRYSHLLTRVTLVMVLVVFALNTFSSKPPVDSLLFAIALAVGMAPELLPAIISITLSRGAQLMARKGVIVQRLNSIENLGSMDVLCTDKTGTLTEGVVQLDGTLDVHGNASEQVLHYASLNAHLQTGLSNPLDEAIITRTQEFEQEINAYQKIDEVPYDFVRKRLSVIVQDSVGKRVIVTKGALDNVMQVCSRIQDGALVMPLDQTHASEIHRRFAEWSEQGFRVLGLAIKPVGKQPTYTHVDECDLIFAGFLIFFDPPKADVQHTLGDLARLGVQLKIITGDNRLVATHVAQMVGMNVTNVLTGAELDGLHDEALWHVAERTNLFVEVDPNQKERVILALKKAGHVVGYMGDGINDAPALHVADVGISVDKAVDVAKEAADFVLLEHDLDVLRGGIEEGRKTFANTLKYIFTTTSANFGNVFSMAGASLLLPFLPLLAKQILLNNFLSDIPAMAIADDNVDPEFVQAPRRWNIKFIRNFMTVFGLVSSAFDYITFGLLLLLFHAAPEQFRTGWFVESLMTELVVALVVRTRRPFFKSKPGRSLWISTLTVALVTVLIPYMPFSGLLGFTPLAPFVMTVLMLITAFYVAANEAAKKIFYAHVAI